MQVQAINQHARRRYGEFVGAMDMVTELLVPLEKLIARMSEKKAPAGSWRVATPKELAGMLNKARADLEVLKEHAKNYETELVSREWRI